VEAYDLIFVWVVLSLACVDRNQLREAMKRIRRALRPGGLMITEPTHSGFLHRFLKTGEFLAVMREAGFEVKRSAHCISGPYGWRSATSPGRNG
jgi:hypothetical protein